MMTVKQMMGDNQKHMCTIEPETSVQTAIAIMSSQTIRALPVVDKDGLKGIFSERDYVRNIASKRIPEWAVKVQEFMSKELMAVKLEDTLKHCMSLMVKNQLSHLPVMDKKKLIGMISISDIAQGLNSREEAILNRKTKDTI